MRAVPRPLLLALLLASASAAVPEAAARAGPRDGAASGAEAATRLPAPTGRIVDEEMLPRFKSSRYEEGIGAGVAAIDAVVASDLKRPHMRRKVPA